ncbi:RHS repeat-associated core domain-containing protein [Duganella sp. S19_KUP01_CR8]|uniref:RHS repeat-associated core domain-containing protein n=1 Tax=Duganella sp. S19_KUP01_CR8 TaxID=3025502 RepID=UPI002FCDB095
MKKAVLGTLLSRLIFATLVLFGSNVFAVNAPTITVTRDPVLMVNGRNYTLTWSTTDASSVTNSCTSTGTGFAGSIPSPSVSGVYKGSGKPEWVGYPSTCVWTATGPGGSATVTETMSTYEEEPYPAQAQVSATPSNIRVASGQSTAVLIAGTAIEKAGRIVKVELFKDSGAGYGATPVQVVNGVGESLNLTYSSSLPPGTYRFKLRGTDYVGNTVESTPVSVNLVDSPLLGTMSGVRYQPNANANIGPIEPRTLVGWVCQDSVAQSLPYRVYVNAPSGLGGVMVASGLANVASETDNEAVQAQCHTPGVPHHFAVSLGDLYSNYGYAPLFVEAQAASGNSTFVLPCSDTNCTVPVAFNVYLSSPANGDRYTAGATVVARAQAPDAATNFDEVSISFNGQWFPATKGSWGEYFVSKAGLTANPTPYSIQARVRKGAETVYSGTRQIFVAASNQVTMILAPANNGKVVALRPAGLRVTLAGPFKTVKDVKFYVNGALLGSGVSGESNDTPEQWDMTWPAMQGGLYAITARAFDANGVQVAQSLVSNVTAELSSASFPPPELNLIRTPATMIAGQPFSVTWTSKNLTSLGVVCTTQNGGYTTNGWKTLAFNNTEIGTANADWVGAPSTCTWTGSGNGGNISYVETMTTVVAGTGAQDAGNPVVAVSSPVSGSSYVTDGTDADSSATVTVTGTATPAIGATIAKLEVIEAGVSLSMPIGGNNLNTTVALKEGKHQLQLRATDTSGRVTASAAVPVDVTRLTAGVNARFIAQNVPATMRAGQPYSVTVQMQNTGTTTWTAAGAYRLGTQNPQDTRTWNSTGRAYLTAPVATGQMAIFTIPVTAPLRGDTYNFQWRMLQDGGMWFGDTTPNLAIPVANGAGPSASLSVSPTNVRMVGSTPATLTFTAAGAELGHKLTKLEVFVDTGSGFPDTAAKTATGDLDKLGLNYTATATAGVYKYKARSTDELGVQTESPIVLVNVTNSTLLGQVSGVRIDSANKPQLIGWLCQPGVAQALNYQVLLDAPTTFIGGTALTSGIADIGTEIDNPAVQNSCGTQGASHHFKVDLSAYATQYPGRAIYVRGLAASGGADVLLPCADNSCTIPGSLRIALSLPANGQHYTGPAPVFMRTLLSGGAGPYDEVALGVDGTWTAANPDGAVDAYSLTSASLPARAVPYAIQSRVRQGNTTLYSAVNMISVDVSNGVSVALVSPASGASVASGDSMNLSATTAGSVAPASVKFYANAQLVATATQSGSSWTAVWNNIVAGTYNVTAAAFDGNGILLSQTAPVLLTAIGSGNSSETPLAVQIDTPHLKNADAGTLPGELGINNAGAATYGMPIVVPPGTAGLQPSISLDYNSQGGNSIVGLGWSISGMSRIARCGQTIDQDGVNARINFSLTDRLCLDGQRLVLVNLAMSDLNYWADTAEYRTEHDGFSRITARGVTTGDNLAGRSFQVKSKDGRIMTYGGTASSVVKAIVQAYACDAEKTCTSAAKNGPIGWALDTVKDRYGNYINYNYTQSPTTGEHVLADIRYGGNGLAPHASVVFTSDTKRSDAWTRYIDAARNDLRRRVNNISTYVGDDLSADATAGTRIRSYTLTYERSPTSGRSLLNKIGVAARNPQTAVDDVLPETIFSWGKPDEAKHAGFEAPVAFLGGPRLSQLTTSNPVDNKIHANLFAFADFENHGFTDILEKSVAPLDVPKTDLQQYADMSLKTSYRYFHNNDGKGFTEYSYIINTGKAFGVLETADFNGDGAPDLLVWSDAKLAICLSPLGAGGSLGDAGSTITFTCDPTLPTTGSAESRYVPYIVDILGDGRSALYGRVPFGGGDSTLCIQHKCKAVADPPGAIVGFSYAADGSPEFYRHDYSEYSGMVDYAGVGKPFDTHFSKPHFTNQIFIDEQPRDKKEWVNMKPTISILAVDDPSTTVSSAPVGGYGYRQYPAPGITARVPYMFEDNTPGMGRDGDFNGSGYSSLAFGFLEYNYDQLPFTYSRAEMTLCLSTGRSLDCHVRKKYSGSTLGAFDGIDKPNRLQYLAVRGVGNFIGDGQPSILAESMKMVSSGPFGTTNLYMCRVMGDDVSTKDDGSDDSNIECDPWAAPTGVSGEQRFFLDVLGTGRTQLVTYHEDWNASDPGKFTSSWSVSKPTDVAVDGQALDRIYAVKNGMGATSTVTYTEGLVDGTVKHSGKLALAYPQHLSSGVGKYATTLTTANGASGNLVRTYRFEDPVIDVNGRGSLGFAHVTIKDEQSQVQTDTDFGIKWPLTGMVRQEVVSRGGKKLSQTDNTLALTMLAQANGGHTWFPAVANSVVQRWDLSGAEMGTTTTSGSAGGNASITYDTYGNVLSSRVVVSGANPDFAHTTDTVNTYTTNDAERLYLGLPDSVTVTKSHNGDGGTAVARKVAMEYESSGKIKSQTVEPDTPALKLKTSFTYDSTFGVLLTKQLNWFDPDAAKETSRVEATMTYDAKARFPATVKNALEHLETHAYNAGTGARTKLTGPNGLSTVWEVNGFGRVTRELRADGNASQSYMKQCAGDCLGSEVAVVITEQFHGADRIAVPQVAYMDNVGHVLRTLTWGFDGSAITSNKTYDVAGLPLDDDVPHYGSVGMPAVHREYDALHRPVLVRTFADNGKPAKDGKPAIKGDAVDSTFTYDGLKVTLTNAKQQSRIEYKNVLGMTSSVENVVADSTKTLTTKFSYDAWGSLVKTIDPNGNVIKVGYDTLGRKIKLNDPDLGQIDYSVNPLGLVWKQVNPVQRAKGDSFATQMKFDALNRMTDRVEDNLESHWIYDTATLGKGQLAEAYTGKPATKDYRRTHSYDTLGRPASTTQQLFDGSYVSTVTYDAWGRPIGQSYNHVADPVKEFVQRYNKYGYLERVERKGLVLWQVNEQDAVQHPTKVKLGNGLAQSDSYSEQSGRLLESLTDAGGLIRLQEAYHYDMLGNVTQRTQYWDTSGFIESFEYDDLNRLTLSRIGSADKVFTYDDAGNLMSKTGVGTGKYAYPAQGETAVRPHAVTGIAGITGSFNYDGNGNLLSDPWRTVTWTNFDMPIKIAKGGKSSTFVYGSEHQRTRQTRDDGTMTVYGGAQEVELDGTGKVTTVKTYWPMGLGVEIDKVGATATELHWTHRDRLGSVVAISSEAGAVQEPLAYDAWGKRRMPDGSATPDNLDGVIDNKGYTGHEMLDPLDLVHMNGRVYDPFVAKFMSGDPLIQDPTNGQNYNRYSYVLNNPTNMTDPTGFAVCDGGATEGCYGQSMAAQVNTVALGTPKVSGDGESRTSGQKVDPNASTKQDVKSPAPTTGSPAPGRDSTNSSGSGPTCTAGSSAGTCATRTNNIVQDGMPVVVVKPEGYVRAKPSTFGVTQADREVAHMFGIAASGLPFDRAIVGVYRGYQFVNAARAARALRTSEGMANSVSGMRLNAQLAAERAAGARAPTAITEYSEHVLQQIAGRDGGIGVSEAALRDAFANPTNIRFAPSKYGPTFQFIGQDATIVVNTEGRAVTGWGTSAAGVK